MNLFVPHDFESLGSLKHLVLGIEAGKHRVAIVAIEIHKFHE